MEIDIHKRFRKELRKQQLPETVQLVGNDMQVALAKALLKKYSRSQVGEGPAVQLMSLEQYGSNFLGVFLEESNPPTGFFLFYTIPEEELCTYAKGLGIPVVQEEKNDCRKMLEKISESQPQVFFALERSSERLKEITDQLK